MCRSLENCQHKNVNLPLYIRFSALLLAISYIHLRNQQVFLEVFLIGYFPRHGTRDS